MGDMGGVAYVRDIEIGIGTCLTVFLTKVTDLLTYLLNVRTDYRDAIASKNCETNRMIIFILSVSARVKLSAEVFVHVKLRFVYVYIIDSFHSTWMIYYPLDIFLQSVISYLPGKMRDRPLSL